MKNSKKCSESHTVMTNIVLPNETNSLNNMFGGELLARMDRAAAIAASRHSQSTVVTASVNHVAQSRYGHKSINSFVGMNFFFGNWIV